MDHNTEVESFVAFVAWDRQNHFSSEIGRFGWNDDNDYDDELLHLGVHNIFLEYGTSEDFSLQLCVRWVAPHSQVAQLLGDSPEARYAIELFVDGTSEQLILLPNRFVLIDFLATYAPMVRPIDWFVAGDVMDRLQEWLKKPSR